MMADKFHTGTALHYAPTGRQSHSTEALKQNTIPDINKKKEKGKNFNAAWCVAAELPYF